MWPDHAPELLAQYGQATKEALAATPVLVTLAGRVTALRRFGKAAFASIQDGTAALQVYLKKDVLGEPGIRGRGPTGHRRLGGRQRSAFSDQDQRADR